MTLLTRLYRTLQARDNCRKSGNVEWESRHNDTLRAYSKDFPHGSGFDIGTVLEDYCEDKMIFATSFHHMDDVGYYVGWSSWRVIVRPGFDGPTWDVECLAPGPLADPESGVSDDVESFGDYVAESFSEAFGALPSLT